MAREKVFYGEGGLPYKVGFIGQFGSIFGLEEAEAVIRVMKGTFFSIAGGVPESSEHYQFEKEFAAYCGVKYARAVHSASSALSIATKLFRFEPGDEVITTPLSFIATSLYLLKVSAVPVFADVDPRTLLIDPAKVAELITDKTRAIYVSSYDGQLPDMDPIMELAKKHGLYTLTDAARSPGAEYKGRKAGSITDMTAFSFQSQKNMSTGEGGALTIRDSDKWGEEATRMRSMWGIQEEMGMLGDNYRMDELRAAIGRVQLKKLDMFNEMRRKNGHYLSEGLAEIEGVTPPYEDPNCKHVFHWYCAQIDSKGLGIKRDDFLRVLNREEGIWSNAGKPDYLHPMYQIRGYKEGLCPIAEEKSKYGMFTLPIHPAMTQEQLDMIIEGVANAVKKVKEGHTGE